MAVGEERPGLAQLWLRRTAIHSDDEASDQGIARDYKILRRINPWSFRLSGGIQPSDNVNNGAESPIYLINGEPSIGSLSGSALALSGVIATFDANVSYRLRESKKSQTHVGARFFSQRVRLSDSARATAPGVSNGDFTFNFGELSLNHAFVVGQKDRPGEAKVGLAVGQAHYGGNKIYDFVRINGARSWRLSETTRFELSGAAESRKAALGTLDADILTLTAMMQRHLGNGNRLDLTFSIRDSDATNINGTSRSASIRALYSLGKKVGPARMQAGLGIASTNYPQFFVGIAPVASVIERQDEAINANLDFVFEDIDYAGFVPRLSIQAARSRSNDSRFTTRQLTLSLGITSKF